MNSSFRRPLTITRLGKATLMENGRFSDPTETTLVINASVQPMKANEMQALPEGRRGCRAMKVYSDVQLNMANQMTGQQADRFMWFGTWFEVVASDFYQNNVINHYRAYATEMTDH